MSSRFSPGKQSVKLPVICIAPKPDLPPPYVDDEPTSLQVTAWWKEPAIGISLAEYFQLFPDSGLPGFSGSSGNIGDNLLLKVQRLPAANFYDIILELRDYEEVIDDDSWHNVLIEPGPPWDSGYLAHVHDPGNDENGCHVVD